MKQDSPAPTIEQLRNLRPDRGLFTAAIGGFGDMLLCVTPLAFALDKDGGTGLISRTFSPKIHQFRGPVTIGLGAVVGLYGLYRGLQDAQQNAVYRDARLGYSAHMERRVEALEKKWAEKTADAPETPPISR